MENRMQNDKKYIKQRYHIWEKWIMWYCDTEYNHLGFNIEIGKRNSKYRDVLQGLMLIYIHIISCK
jgi:hypothetical protein